MIGLGSNLGDRSSTIEQAIARLEQDDEIHVTDRSPLYETAAEGGAPQPDYANGAVLLLTALDAHELLRRLLDIEQGLGRVRGEKNAPRTIDLDILWIEGESIQETDLVVPHPRLAERAFMLRPLLDVASDASDPVKGVAFAELALAAAELKRLL